MKTSFFKRKPLFRAASGASNNSDDEETDFFSRSDETFRKREARRKQDEAERIAKEEAERNAAEVAAREAEEAEQNAREAAREAAEAKEVEDNVTERNSKRIRLSQDEEELGFEVASANAPEDEDGPFTPKGTNRELARTPSTPTRPPPRSARSTRSSKKPETSLSQSYGDVLDLKATQPSTGGTVIVDLDPSDEDKGGDIPPSDPLAQADDLTITNVNTVEPVDDFDDELSDPELAELSRKARERARSQRFQAEVPSTPHPSTPLGTSFQSIHKSRSVSRPNDTAPLNSETDVHIQYTISSKLPRTTLCRVQRKFHQRTKEVRQHWCHEQGFPETFANNIVLTFKDKRIWDSTTCSGLGFGVVDGQIVFKRAPYQAWNNKISLEAMTLEAYQQLEAELEKSQDAVEEDVEPTPPPEPEPVKERGIRIILKSKQYSEFKCIAKPGQLVSRVIGAFRVTNNISHERDVQLMFDGESLNPNTMFRDTELEDMDSLDVTIS